MRRGSIKIAGVLDLSSEANWLHNGRMTIQQIEEALNGKLKKKQNKITKRDGRLYDGIKLMKNQSLLEKRGFTIKRIKRNYLVSK